MIEEMDQQKLRCFDCPTEIVVQGIELKDFGGIFCGNCGTPLGFRKDESTE